MPSWLLPTWCFLFAFSALGVWGVMHIARKKGVLDIPHAPKKMHSDPTPLWGGIAPALLFVTTVVVIELLTGFFTSGMVERQTLWGFLGGVLMLLVGGAVDDMRPLPPRISFLFPLCATLLVVFTGMGVSKLTNPFGGSLDVLPVFSLGITFLWILCVTYTTKLLDGVDGLVSGVGLVGASMVALLAYSPRWYQPDIGALAALFFAALLGFFVWNLPKAKIFGGEGGSTVVGFVLGSFAVMGGSKFATLLLVVGLPALDVAFVMTRRILAGRSPFLGGDGLHLHVALQRRGWMAWKIVVLYMGVAGLFGATTLILTSWQKLFALVVLAMGACFGMIRVSQTSRV